MARRGGDHRIGVVTAFVLGGILFAGCGGHPESNSEALSLLGKMVRAEQTLCYRVVTKMSPSFRFWPTAVVHYAGGPTVLELPSGDRRVGDFPWFYWLKDQDLLKRNYQVTRDGSATVIGRPALVLRITSFWKRRPSMRLTVDAATSLPLEVEKTAWNGRSAFHWKVTKLTIDPKLAPPPPEKQGRGWWGLRFHQVAKGEKLDLPFVPLAVPPGGLPRGFEQRGRYLVDRPTRGIKTIYSDGLTWIEISQWKAASCSGKEGVAKEWRHGGSTRFHAVLNGREVWLHGQLAPRDLLSVVQSLYAVEGS